MAVIKTRQFGPNAKGSLLTNQELDNNFINIATELDVDSLPTVAPSLNLDFVNCEKLDPRFTFVRTSTATYYDGVTVAKAEENLLLQSATPHPSPWAWSSAGYVGALGSELATNANKWSSSYSSSVTVNSATSITYTTESSGNWRETFFSGLVSGKKYLLTFTSNKTADVGGSWFVYANGSSLGEIPAGGSNTFVFTFLTSFYFFVHSFTNGTLSNISIREYELAAVAAPNGTSTASTLNATAANATFTQSVSLNAGDHTFSVWLRRVTGTGNVDITAHSGGTWVTQTITSSWARYTVTQTLTAGARTPGIRIATAGDQVEVWGAQLEQRSSVTAYTPTTTAPITNYVPQLLTAPAGVPRFDHNPVTGESLGLLIEEQRTNLLLRSEEFDNTVWTKTNVTVNHNTTISPFGGSTADAILETSPNAAHIIEYQNVSINSGATYTLSAYIKANGRTRGRLYLYQPVFPFSEFGSSFDLIAGTPSSQLTPVGNGWFRFQVSGVCGTATAAHFRIILKNDSNQEEYAGDSSKGIYLWGAQLEAGAFPTSYIRTVASTVTRSAEIATASIAPWFNIPQGTWYIESIRNGSVGSHTQLAITAGASYDSGYGMLVRYGNNSTIQFGGNTSAVSVTGNAVGSINKIAASYQKINGSLVANGGTVNTMSTLDFTGSGILAPTNLIIGALTTNNVQQGNNYIRHISYYPIRFTDVQLKFLTRP